MRLKNKIALITGGSRGIGFATADAFLREGAIVIIAASRQEHADKAVAELKQHINNELNIDCPITTFHSTGYAIVRKTEEERKKIVDKIAATYILQGYLDRLSNMK